MNEFMTHIHFDYNKEALLKEFDNANLSVYTPSRKINEQSWFNKTDTWLTAVADEQSSEMYRIKCMLEDTFNEPVTAKFFLLKENEHIPPHKDMGHRVCINIVLSNDAAPVKFKDGPEESYECAMLNVFKRHEVLPGPERKMVKFQIGENLFYRDALQIWENGTNV